MLQANLDRDQPDHFAKPGHLQVFHFPDFQHLRAELLTHERHSLIANVDRVKVMFRQGFPDGIVGKRECVNEVEQIREVSPHYFFLKGAKTERSSSPLLDLAGVIAGTESMTRQFVAKPAEPYGSQVVAQKFH